MKGGYKQTVICEEQTARARSSASKDEVMRISNEDEESRRVRRWMKERRSEGVRE